MEITKEALCPSCGGKELRFSLENYEVEYKGHSRTVEALKYYECESCSESFYTKPSERKMDKAFTDLKREVGGLLTSQEIKKLRMSLELTQEKLSLLLGMALKTIARYENGSVTQSRATDLLLRLIRDNPSNIEYLDQYTIQFQSQLRQKQFSS